MLSPTLIDPIFASSPRYKIIPALYALYPLDRSHEAALSSWHPCSHDIAIATPTRRFNHETFSHINGSTTLRSNVQRNSTFLY
mmetsp:Transcript_7484/g.16183  ORF Transcript_7484/g.16183 Transcript_7484/m.16183 type:complete len:83 (-) Transcript_7484:2068-2316(-)